MKWETGGAMAFISLLYMEELSQALFIPLFTLEIESIIFTLAEHNVTLLLILCLAGSVYIPVGTSAFF